jgi:hypothetical protein
LVCLLWTFTPKPPEGGFKTAYTYLRANEIKSTQIN